MKIRFLLPLVLLLAPMVAIGDGPSLSLAPDAAPIPYVPYTLADLVNPGTGVPYAATDEVVISDWRGTAQELLDMLNRAEQFYCARGVSLRRVRAQTLVELVDSAKVFDPQFLASLNLVSEHLSGAARTPLAACPDVDLGTLGINPETGTAFVASELLPMRYGLRITAGDLVKRIDEQRKILCQLGHDLLGGVPTSGSGVLEALLRRRDVLLTQLGISDLHALFDLVALPDAPDFADIIADANRAAQGGPDAVAAVYDLAAAAGGVLPPELEVPDLPNIPSPTLPHREDLDLIKRLTWPGFDEGDRSIAAIYANAWFEVRGQQSTKTLDARGEGKAGAYVLGNEVNFIYASAFFDGSGAAGTASGDVRLNVLGLDVYHQPIQASAHYEDQNDRLWEHGEALEYAQTFAVGPVPVNVRFGVRGSLYIGYTVALVPVSISGQIKPGLEMDAFAEAGVGVGGILSAGVGGQLTLIDAGIPLRGKATLDFDPAGLPKLGLSIASRFEYELLSGRVYLFADFPVPFEIKHAEKTLFDWRGERGAYTFFNWGIQVSPFGVQLSGNSVDANDRTQAAALEQRLELEEREAVLAGYEQSVDQKEHDVFGGMLAGLNSETTRQVTPDALPALAAQLEGGRNQYLASLANTIH